MNSYSILAYGVEIPNEYAKVAKALLTDEFLAEMETKLHAHLIFIPGVEEAESSSFVYFADLAIYSHHNTGVPIDINMLNRVTETHYMSGAFFIKELAQRDIHLIDDFGWNLFSWSSWDS
jgi:hypothetical protein